MNRLISWLTMEDFDTNGGIKRMGAVLNCLLLLVMIITCSLWLPHCDEVICEDTGALTAAALPVM